MTSTIRKSLRRVGARCTLPAATLLALAAPSPTRAQQVGEGPIVLRLPANARILAMGNAGLASTDGDALLYNVGMLSQSRGAALSVQRYGSHATAGAFGSVTTSGSFTFGLGAQFLDWRAPSAASYGEAIAFGGSHLSDGGSVEASSTAFTIGIARTIKGQRLGAGIKYADERFGERHDGAVALDLGMVRPLWRGNLGVTVQNIGTGIRLGGERGSLPRRIGVGYGMGPAPFNEYLDLGAQMQLLVEEDGFVRPAGGVELGFVPIEGVAILVRAGLRLPREPDEPLATGGLGLNADRYSVDYAIEPFRGGRPVSHRVGIRIRP